MDNFKLSVEAVKICLSASWVFFVEHVGISYKHIIALLVFMAIDTVTGWLVHKKLGDWASSKARWGFVGKIVELMFVAALYLLDWLFEMDSLKYIGIYYFIICEGASFVENIAQIDKNIPQGFVELLKSFQASAGTWVVNKVKTIIESLGGKNNG